MGEITVCWETATFIHELFIRARRYRTFKEEVGGMENFGDY